MLYNTIVIIARFFLSDRLHGLIYRHVCSSTLKNVPAISGILHLDSCANFMLFTCRSSGLVTDRSSGCCLALSHLNYVLFEFREGRRSKGRVGENMHPQI